MPKLDHEAPRLEAHVLRDLMTKVHADVNRAANDAVTLAANPHDRLQLSLAAVSGPLGIAGGYTLFLVPGASPEQVVEKMLAYLRPVALSAVREAMEHPEIGAKIRDHIRRVRGDV